MQKALLKILFFLLVFFGSKKSAFSSEIFQDLNFINLSTKDGLSANTVTDILKDKYGFLWFATEDGLNKYDGKIFKVYRNILEDSTSIASNEILDIYEAKNGNLWIGTNIGLVLYDRAKDKFLNFTKSYNAPAVSLCEDDNGMVLAAGYGGVSVFNPVKKEYTMLSLENKDYSNMQVNKVFKDTKGRIWIGTVAGLFQYLSKEKTLKLYKNPISSTPQFRDNMVFNIFEDSKNRIWIGTNSGLRMLNENLTDFTVYRNAIGNINTLSSNIVYTIGEEKNGRIWVGTEEGLNILDPSTGFVIRVPYNGSDFYSIKGKSVKSILIDKQGIYWVSTFQKGINKYDKNLALFDFQQINLSQSNHLNSLVVTSFASSEDKNNIYVATDGGGLYLFNTKTKQTKPVLLSKTSGKDDLSILSMAKVNNEIWVGTFLDGIYILDTKTGVTKHITKGKSSQNIKGSDVFCITKDSRGNVWVGTNGEGIDRYNLETKTFTHFGNTEKGDKKIGLNNYIRAISEDAEGNMWIGSSGSGLAVYNPITGKSKVYNKNNSKLPSNNVLTILSSKNGDVWIGTLGGGLVYYDKTKSDFIVFSECNGLSNNVVYKILEDDLGGIWLSTNKGLSRFDIHNKKFKNYSSHNGLQQNPFTLNSGIRLNDGRLFFGGADGFNYFNPTKLFSNKNVPNVVLTDLKIANQSVSPSETSPILEHISIVKDIFLDYKQNFSLSFSALNYTSPQENRYFYQLEGFDKEWNSVGGVNTAVYTNLDPGEYLFKVKAESESGDWKSKETTIKIFVKPPFWQTYYAYFFYFLSFSGILWFSRKRGIQKLQMKFAIEQERLKNQQTLEQERRDSERIRELDKLKIKFLTNISHEFRTPISLIIGPVEQLIQQETNITKSDHLRMVKRNANRLQHLVNQLLDFRNIKTNELKLNVVECDFISFSKEVADSFKDLATRRQINYEFKSNLKTYFTRFDKDKIERVLFNLLSNAFKFTQNQGNIFLKIENLDTAKGLKITLRDTGIGIKSDLKDKIFDRFFQIENNNTSVLNQGSGIGLSIAKEFVKLHNGTIEVESMVNKGSTFTIYLPLESIEKEMFIEEDILLDELLDINTENDIVLEPANLPLLLLVEDNDDYRSFLISQLKNKYKILEASNGKEGWQKVLFSHPDLIISDVNMPYINGIELCEKIKSDKRTSHIPVLLLTALIGEEDQLLGLEKGANDYLTKPFKIEFLIAKIKNLLVLNDNLKKTYSKRIQVATQEIEFESDNEKMLNEIIRYTESNLTNPQLSVEDLSRHLGMSRGSLYSKLLEVSGETPVEFIRSIRLKKAAMLLEKSDMNVSQICYAVGFSTPNYFTRAFKAQFNMLPSQYINEKRQERKVNI